MQLKNLAAASFVFLSLGLSGQNDPFLRDLLAKWDNTSAYTLAIVTAMPTEHYDYQPLPEVRTFADQVVHTANNVGWLCSTYLGGAPFPREEPEGKKAIEDYLQRSLTYARTTLENLDLNTLDEEVDFFAGPMPRRRILFLLNDHLTHHRGQIILYLRMQGIEPTRYIGW